MTPPRSAPMSERLTPWWVAEGLGKYAMTDELLALRVRIEDMRKANEGMVADRDSLRAENDRLLQLLAKASVALSPFDAFADMAESFVDSAWRGCSYAADESFSAE